MFEFKYSMTEKANPPLTVKSTNKSEPYSNCRSKSPMVFCIHGNKWGIATCCEELEEHQHPGGQKEPMVEQTFNVLNVCLKRI